MKKHLSIQSCGFLAAMLMLLLGGQRVRASSDPASVRHLIRELASDDPRLRESAATELMGLHRVDLPVLRSAALSESPLLPGQVAAIRQVVAQVYLAGEPFQIDPSNPSGFVGIQLPPFERQSGSLVVMDRIRGFPAYRYLRNGDAILSLVDLPRAQLQRSQDFINVVALFRPGDILRLSVMRDGRVMTVALPLDFRPLALSSGVQPPVVEAWMNQRDELAEEYWKREFSILDRANEPDDGGPSASIHEP